MNKSEIKTFLDSFKEKKNRTIVIVDFSNVEKMRYLHDTYNKKFIVFGARGHTGKDVQEAVKEGVVDRILYADDFEYRLSMDRN